MTEAMQAEWTKLRTLTGTVWLLVGGIAVTTGVSAAVAAVTHQSASGADPTKVALCGIDVGQAVVVMLAVLAITDEYGTGMICVSLTAVPRRLTLLAAKAVNVAGLTFVVGAVAVAGCLIAGRLLLNGGGLEASHRYAPISLTHSFTLRAATGSIVYLVLIGLLALGIATAIRDTAVATGIVLALLYLPPLLAEVVRDPLRRHLQQVTPMSAGLAIQATTDLRRLPIAPWAGIGVLAAWAAVSLLVGATLLWLRDA